MRWLRSVTRITDQSQLIGIPFLAAFLQLELFRVSTRHTLNSRGVGCAQSPESLTRVSSSGFLPLPPSRNLNLPVMLQAAGALAAWVC
ncbi:hypothetical protein CLM71_02905 [Serratia sp. MYb239]|nr:hypothetical protein CLM71_02905 [Serratia sp. MYb239]